VGLRNTKLLRTLMQVAAGGLVLVALAGCGRVTARIDTHRPTDPGTPVRVEAGATTTLSLTFTNTGNRTGSFTPRVTVWDGFNVRVGERNAPNVSVPAGQQRTVTWDYPVLAPGTYSLQFSVWKQDNTLLAQAPQEPQRLIVAVPAVASTKFGSGDRVRTVQTVNVRTGPGTSNREVTHVNYREHAAVGAQGRIIGGPDKADGYVWWRVEFDVGFTGWCIEDALTRATGG